MSPATAAEVSGLVDERAAMWAAAMVTPTARPGAGEVAALRAAIAADVPAIDRAVRGFTGLGADVEPARVDVVGRAGWVRANLVALRGMFEPLRDRLGDRPGAAQVLGVQLGTVFGLLSSKVLGQYVLPLSGDGDGRLVVVGPNLLALDARHGAMAGELRRAVLAHEVTHYLQFGQAGWMAGYLRGLVDDYLADARLTAEALRATTGRLGELVAEVRAAGTLRPLIDSVMTDTQRKVMNDAQALMTLLEGHGNATMYGAGVLDDPDGVRRALTHRRPDVTTWILTTVLGMDAKRRQYRDGEAFVRAVLEHAGVEGLNRAFAGPDALPDLEEVAAPQAWLDRTG